MKKSLVLLLTTLLFTGCLSLRLGGGGRKTTTHIKSDASNVTLGQQLIDLQKAYESGIITEREYKSQRKKLLRSK